MGGRFGEMSTLMNYTFQSFDFRGRQCARPFYDLSPTSPPRSTGTSSSSRPRSTRCSPAPPGRRRDAPNASLSGSRKASNPHHFIAGGQGALPQDSRGTPWTGDYVFSSGDLVEDLTHNFFLETGARNNKLKVYEMVDHPAARALTGYLLVRGGVHQVAYARALEKLTGADLTKMFPTPRIPTDEDPRVQAAHRAGDHKLIYRFSPNDYQEIVAVFNGPHPETGEELEVGTGPPGGRAARDLPPQPAVFAPDYAPEEIAEIAQRLRKDAGPAGRADRRGRERQQDVEEDEEDEEDGEEELEPELARVLPAVRARARRAPW